MPVQRLIHAYAALMALVVCSAIIVGACTAKRAPGKLDRIGLLIHVLDAYPGR